MPFWLNGQSFKGSVVDLIVFFKQPSAYLARLGGDPCALCFMPPRPSLDAQAYRDARSSVWVHDRASGTVSGESRVKFRVVDESKVLVQALERHLHVCSSSFIESPFLITAVQLATSKLAVFPRAERLLHLWLSKS